VAKQPNSFVYRFVPYNVSNIAQGGKLQALQVWIDGSPVVFTADAVADTFSTKQLKLHTLGTSYSARWVTVHDTAVSTASFNANTAAKNALATPFKRPENIAFLPGSGFNTFFFDPTGDTDVNSGSQPALLARGAYGSIFRVDFPGDSSNGTISIFYRGDSTHNSFDNVTFADNETLLATEDRGDLLHSQLNTLDSIWAFDVRHPGTPRRLVALGRDPESNADVQANGEGDNEPTGLHVSDGSSTIGGLLYKHVKPNAARWFFTQQHGDNVVYEITPAE
jgi:secreted PhoX family phosphatase